MSANDLHAIQSDLAYLQGQLHVFEAFIEYVKSEHPEIAWKAAGYAALTVTSGETSDA